MRRMILRTFSVTVMLILVALSARGGFAGDNDHSFNFNRILRGKYGVTEFRSCVQTLEGGFTSDFQLQLDGSARWSVQQQIRTYDGRGTGELIGVVTNMFLPFFPGGGRSPNVFNQSEFTCKIKYTVNPDRSYMETVQECDGTILPVPSDGRKFTVTPSTREGQIDPGGKNLIYSITDPQIQSLSVFDPDVNPLEPGMAQPLLIRDRICIRSGKGVKIKEPRENRD